MGRARTGFGVLLGGVGILGAEEGLAARHWCGLGAQVFPCAQTGLCGGIYGPAELPHRPGTFQRPEGRGLGLVRHQVVMGPLGAAPAPLAASRAQEEEARELACRVELSDVGDGVQAEPPRAQRLPGGQGAPPGWCLDTQGQSVFETSRGGSVSRWVQGCLIAEAEARPAAGLPSGAEP